MQVLIVDDSEINRLLVEAALDGLADGGCVAFSNPIVALAYLQTNAPKVGVLVTDHDMPEMTGIDLIEAARATKGFAEIPIVIVTGNDEKPLRRRALDAGATDFVTKPFDPMEVRARVRNLLLLEAARRRDAARAKTLAEEVRSITETVRARELEIVYRLARAAEHRDGDTGDHIARVSEIVRLIALELGLDSTASQDLAYAASMHDVGKLGVADTILLKQGPLTADERTEMQRHAEHGFGILAGSTSALIALAAEIALTHHERWDGQGYPRRLQGEDIPLGGRITAIADVFDALANKRPYKDAWPLSQAREHIASEAGRHFDPRCVEAFLAAWPKIEAVIAARARDLH